jgi:hypothetical protein
MGRGKPNSIHSRGCPLIVRHANSMTAMIFKTLGLLSLAILAGASAPRCARATSTQDEAESCRSFVEQFYNLYEPLDPGQPLDSTSLGEAVQKKQVDPDLAGQLRAVLDAQAQSGQTLLDFDPIINGRDPSDKYVAGSVMRKGEHYLVEVYGVSDDRRKHDNPDVIAELVFQVGRWTFVNCHYPNRSDSPASENLLSLLKSTRRSLGEKQHARSAGSNEGDTR